jgi:hypothetical protein
MNNQIEEVNERIPKFIICKKCNKEIIINHSTENFGLTWIEYCKYCNNNITVINRDKHE